ncbi:hypothetical protein C5748_15685 [Phyllobacterium phragmitis]|uniref:Uncharacterized protein n=1 Tax=Phyllobacterium phragmitis TaxID=2670329 RepID=A0A2S9IPX5_9HYPH|nr:hypothetical protein [Phyllobacterium phragmitis]PRD42542.1 hypothetical protein C5748_15685 [Phyllobacterium phragmitis]
MALFRFRTRSPDRDLQTDVSRFADIKQTLNEVCAEIERERDGFQRRYDEISMNAAFSLENMENEGETEKVSARIEDFTLALERFTQRIAFLEKQLAFLQGVDQSVTEFADKNGLWQADAVPNAPA